MGWAWATLQEKLMDETDVSKPNTYFIEVSGSGLPEVDGLFVPSMAPPPNPNQEPSQVLAIGMAKWLGIEPMAKRPEARLFPTRTVTVPGESPVSMVTSPTTLQATRRCRPVIENGTFIRRASPLLPRWCSITLIRGNRVPSRTWCSFLEDRGPEKGRCGEHEAEVRDLQDSDTAYS